MNITRYFTSFIPFSDTGRLARWYNVLNRINSLEEPLKNLSNTEIKKAGLSLRYRAKSGESLKSLLPEAFALVREASRRTIGLRHFDVQILGGTAMFHRSIVEMQTGEGKTLTATLPLYLYALSGKGALLATVNDYLAERDANLLEPVYNLLGLTVGVVKSQMPTDQRRKAYQCDITYGTAKEFGFDFLRDRLLLRRIREGQHDLFGAMLGHKKQGDEKPVQREQYFILADEADSILIDEASTPLIISAAPTEDEQKEIECYYWASDVAAQFENKVDYEYDNEKKTVELTRGGRTKVRLLNKPEGLDEIDLVQIYEFVQRAIRVNRDFHRDEHYVVRKGEIVIVDEFTGRLGEGRKWQDGIHQAIEAREKVKVTVDTGQAARITIQDYFLRFENLAGMTGTGVASKGELHRIYRCNVIAIPTNKPPHRRKFPTLIFATERAKWQAVIQEIEDMHQQGRPVLIGTRTIDKSIVLSQLLKEKDIIHSVLNANHIAEEAEIVARAGEAGKVTVSTNMAGRGTDIKIPDEVVELGGLHVICTEMHESARIDRQLIGRCGRQGDPGTFRQYLSFQDDLLKRAFGADKAAKYSAKGERTPDKMFNHHLALFRRAQRKAERRNFRNRKIMLYYEKERKKMQRSMGQDPYLDTPH
ncbi:MAG: translocase [Planctomycetaceae bacterium]|nr:translocase [Planctomycetaceae bacterium]